MSYPDLAEPHATANRLNAQKSTGPRTEAGKNIARFNARRHGLTGQFYCMSDGDEKAYNDFQVGMLASLLPEGAYETQLAISITQDHWRINRSRAVEHNLYAQGHDRHADQTDAPSANVQAACTMAETYREDDRHIANLALYETRIHRMIAKSEKRLAELKAERQAAADKLRDAEATARHEAELLVRLARRKRETLEQVGLTPLETPAGAQIEVNGFVFAVPQLRRNINREDQLREAKFYEQHNWKGDVRYPAAA